MRSSRKTAYVFAFLALTALAGRGQVQASAVSNTMPTPNFGFSLPSRLGTLSYSLTASELLQTGYGGSVTAGTSASGNLAYLSNSERNPFSAVLSGGYILDAGSGSLTSNGFANVAASQVMRTRSWVFVVSDAFSYLPQSPTTGLSGVAGVGDIGAIPVQTGLQPDQTILTNSGQRVANGVSGSASWQLTSRTDLEGSGSYQILRFVGDSIPGYNTDDYAANFGPDYRIDERNSVSASAYYSRQSYPGFVDARIETIGLNFGYIRAWTRAISTNISVGPETTHGQTAVKIPQQTSVAGSASVTYAGRRNGGSLNYSRSVNGGSGVIFGALSDTVSAGFTRPLTREWNFGLNASYSHSAALAQVAGTVPRTNTVFAGAQVSRRLTESLSVYGSYTALHQSVSGFSGANQLYGYPNAFNGFNNIGAVGITFAPAPLNRGR